MSQSIKILLADNDLDDLGFISSALNAIGVQDKYVCVNSGIGALELLEAIPDNDDLPGLIVLDLYMPILNGIDVVKILKAEMRYRNIPVIIFSGSCENNDEINSLNAGATAFIKKPFKFSAYKSIAWQLYGYCTTGSPNIMS